MQVNSVNSNTSFTSVIPVRVYNGSEPVRDQKVVKKACESITKILAGPVKRQSDYDFLSRVFLADPDYSINKATRGYCAMGETPSKHFKIVFDRLFNAFIFTGPDAEKLTILGRNIGVAKRDCNNRHIPDSPELRKAKSDYTDAVQTILSDTFRYIKEEYTTFNRLKCGEPSGIKAVVNVTPRKSDASKFDITVKDLSLEKLPQD